MNRDQGIELAMVLLSLFIYLGYHLWLFWLRDKIHRRFFSKSKHAAVSIQASEARLIWTYLCTLDKTDAGVPTVQTLRNSIMAASFMATTTGLMATSGLLPVLTDASRLQQIAKLGDLDPIVGDAGSHGLVSAPWKIGICEFLLLLSLLFFVQAIRMLMFLAHFIKILSADEPFKSMCSVEFMLAVSRRSGHCWTAGVRLWYFFIPTLLWMFGPTTLLVVTVCIVAFLYVSDEIKVKHVDFLAEMRRYNNMGADGDAARGKKEQEAHAPSQMKPNVGNSTDP